jgi:hypothetical protein
MIQETLTPSQTIPIVKRDIKIMKKMNSEQTSDFNKSVERVKSPIAKKKNYKTLKSSRSSKK